MSERTKKEIPHLAQYQEEWGRRSMRRRQRDRKEGSRWLCRTLRAAPVAERNHYSMDKRLDICLSCNDPNTYEVNLKACKIKPILFVYSQTVNTIMLMKFSLASINFPFNPKITSATLFIDPMSAVLNLQTLRECHLNDPEIISKSRPLVTF